MSIKPNSNPTSSSFPLFDRSRLRLDTLSVREHGLTLDCVKPLLAVLSVQNDFIKIAAAIKTARKNQRSVILMMGAHVLRAGVQRYLIDLMEKGYIYRFGIPVQRTGFTVMRSQVKGGKKD